ncbi:cilia- and flagella-associated protein 184 [Brachyhypopomus gauderio]|uniref:cilia- and flagella-associated protein 184 n=1 Tax=Brachyhypopomus gauderio TaxID=698409 RepID=UPI004042F4DB
MDQSLREVSPVTSAGHTQQCDPARGTQAVEETTHPTQPKGEDRRRSVAEDDVDVTVETPAETADQQGGGEEPEVAMGTELPTSTIITTTMPEEDGEEEEEEEETLAPTIPEWESYRPAGQMEAEQTTAEWMEAEQTTTGQLEAEQTTAERMEAEQTTSEQMEAEQTTTGQLEAEQTTSEQMEAEQTTTGQLEAEQTTTGQLEAEQTTAERIEAEQTTSERMEAEQLKALCELQADRDELILRNRQVQLRLLQQVCRKTSNEPRRTTDPSQLEQTYRELLDTMLDLKRQQHRDSDLHLQQTEQLRQQHQEKVEQVVQEWKTWAEVRREVVVMALTRTLGRQAAQAEAERLGEAEQKREEDLAAVRLKNIKMKMKVQELEATLMDKEELDEGVNLIDFEQLKIENHTYSEKIEERNEELLKLRKEITSTVQVLSHVKEKVEYMQVENRAGRVRLAQLETALARGRDVLTRTRQARDALRTDNLRLRQRCGLLGNVTLLRDFEEKVDVCNVLEEQLETLKRRHAELSVRGAGMRRRVENSRALAHTHADTHTDTHAH